MKDLNQNMKKTDLDHFQLADLVALLDRHNYTRFDYTYTKSAGYIINIDSAINRHIKLALEVWYCSYDTVSIKNSIIKMSDRFQLVQLACKVNVGIKSSNISEEAKARLNRAYRVLELSIKALNEESSNVDTAFHEYCRSLKVGHHLMPAVNPMHLSNNHTFKDALKVVIGLSRNEDNISWFRAHLSDLMKNQEKALNLTGYGDYYDSIYQGMGETPYTDPDFKTLEDRMELARVNGFSNINDFLIVFRKWRLTMKNKDTPLSVPIDIEAALFNGKDRSGY